MWYWFLKKTSYECKNCGKSFYLHIDFIAKYKKKSYEKQTKKSAISKENALNYKYIDDKKLIEAKKSKKKK